jgi:methionine synthase II (cobalamin-independent)
MSQTSARPEQPAPPDTTPLTELFPVRRAWNLTAATGVGSLPGTSAGAAAGTVAGELSALPHVVELPARGVGADMVGRAVGMLIDIYGEVVPSGWRVSRRPGRDTMRAKDFLAWDLDAAQQQYAGAEWVKVQVCGPWTLAAMLEVPSGHRVLTDSGAVDDLAASLAEGLVAHVAEIAKRVPGAGVVVQIDEPSLPDVLTGNLPTASGFGTVRSVPTIRVIDVLSRLTDALDGHPTIAHCCHPAAPLRLLRASGFDALSVDMTILGSTAAALDPVGEAVETGAILLAGVIPSTAPARTKVPLQTWAKPVLQIWDRLGFPRQSLATSVVPTPTCGLAGADQDWAVQAMRLAREISDALPDLPEGW